MADLNELKNIIRIGTVQSVDQEKMTARVKFGDKGDIMSGDLNIIKRSVFAAPTKTRETRNQTADAKLKYDYNGELLRETSHYHEVYIPEWVPEINDNVLCIMVPDGDGDGFIIGEV